MKKKEILHNSIYETNVTVIPKTIQKQYPKKKKKALKTNVASEYRCKNT